MCSQEFGISQLRSSLEKHKAKLLRLVFKVSPHLPHRTPGFFILTHIHVLTINHPSHSMQSLILPDLLDQTPFRAVPCLSATPQAACPSHRASATFQQAPVAPFSQPWIPMRYHHRLPKQIPRAGCFKQPASIFSQF